MCCVLDDVACYVVEAIVACFNSVGFFFVTFRMVCLLRLLYVCYLSG